MKFQGQVLPQTAGLAGYFGKIDEEAFGLCMQQKFDNHNRYKKVKYAE